MDIIEAMQAAVTPVFLLTGVGALVNVMMGRLTRIKDRMRIMQAIGVEANDIDDQKIIDNAKQINDDIRSILPSKGFYEHYSNSLYSDKVLKDFNSSDTSEIINESSLQM